ncbi:MAG: CDP-diacylglycerol--serine O-phosphatidyltransferase [Gammaproteobacteria bacterium]|nr:MAG: CDP-diacylglycerol--serine O-phosphatidyltransferase [Gammaproteobacteria bacterium]
MGRRRGIYLLPNFLTTAGLFAGFYAIIAALHGHFEPAAIAIFIAMAMDSLDGRIARITHTQSDFGIQYDSLADMLSFGIAPALIAYQWILSGMGKLGWLAAFVFTAGAALRLARFNTQVGVADKRYFQGLPSPAAAATLASTVWLGDSLHWEGPWVRLMGLMLTMALGLLMVSHVRYYSLKEFDFGGRVPLKAAILVVLGFVLISINPPQVLFAASLIYVVSGPLLTVVHIQRRRAQRRAGLEKRLKNR